MGGAYGGSGAGGEVISENLKSETRPTDGSRAGNFML